MMLLIKTDQVFGDLKILGEVSPENRKNKIANTEWYCLCICGKTIQVTTAKLRAGEYVSCGCRKRRLLEATLIDISGQKFGRLRVVGLSGLKKHSKHLWECICDCGNTIYVAAQELKKSKTSCGCDKKPRGYTNLIGTRFRHLLVVEDMLTVRNRSRVWKCRCVCGKEINTTASNLRSGDSGSCGCRQHKRGSENINYNPNLTDEERAARRETSDYVLWRQRILARDSYTCRKCARTKTKGVKLHAHHLESYTFVPDLRYKDSNGVTLCKECHEKFHSVYGTKGFTASDFELFKCDGVPIICQV